MGRPPKLTLVNKKHFTKDELNKRQKREEQLINNNRVDKIKAPSWLSQKAKNLFNDLSEDLISRNILDNLDTYSLSLYCHYYIKFLEVEKELKKEGETIEYTNKQGFTNIIENPKLKIKNKYFEIINKLSKDLGLTPMARLRLTVQADNKEDGMSSFRGEFKV